ncbi:MAG: MFS transporter [Candidatus Baldrarchaeota archaeon]
MNTGNSKNSDVPPIIYATAGLTAFSGGLYQPYLNIYAVEIGATYSEMGIITSVSNAAPTILQPIWGALSDKKVKRKPFIFWGCFCRKCFNIFVSFSKRSYVVCTISCCSLYRTLCFNTYVECSTR